MTSPDFNWKCAHCGQVCGDVEGGYGAVIGADGAIHASCSPMDPSSRPDCYVRVNRWHEPVGALLGADPLPAGVEDIRTA